MFFFLFYFFPGSKSLISKNNCHLGPLYDHCSSLSETFDGKDVTYQSHVFTATPGIAVSFVNCKFINHNLFGVEYGLFYSFSANIKADFTLCSFIDNTVTSTKVPLILASDNLYDYESSISKGVCNIAFCKFTGNLVHYPGLLRICTSNVTIHSSVFENSGKSSIIGLRPKNVVSVDSPNAFSRCNISHCTFRNSYEFLQHSVLSLHVNRLMHIEKCSFINCGTESTNSITVSDSNDFASKRIIKDCCFLDRFPGKIHISINCPVYLLGRIIFSSSKKKMTDYFKHTSTLIITEAEILYEQSTCTVIPKTFTEEFVVDNANDANSPDSDTFKLIRVVVIFASVGMLIILAIVIIAFVFLNNIIVSSSNGNNFITIEEVFMNQQISSPTPISDHESSDSLDG
ncbi:hypothetical protein TRFO_27515 [Tritrichomonas foetus]|uniref:Right handed beta helix domain-containing protein n=1 Tax=Tritrichomonas foetus TaxID=1144522 RepID=A0A1J4K0Y9_9EUKA|nr:hypothetical protein TRFO_27515 [Tritrichomonas foetus]|eukprot:OHT04899.1 hypothetical protein TRFO_27515 [Tritrichomonas foetus]